MDQLTESAEVVSGDTERAVRPRTAEELKAAVLDKLTYVVGKDPVAASQRDWFLAVAHATRDIVVERWIEFDQSQLSRRSRSASIISASSFWSAACCSTR